MPWVGIFYNFLVQGKAVKGLNEEFLYDEEHKNDCLNACSPIFR